MKITYTETQGKIPFNWLSALRDLIEKENNPGNIHDKGYMEELGYLASNWSTCACGNQSSIIPRDHQGVPEDIILRRLGYSFDGQINTRRFKAALETLLKIEARSEEIISQISPKLKG